MELKPGYKRTEVGVIPEDWKVTTLSELCTTSSGTTPARSLADRYYRNGCTHWVKTLDLNNSEIHETDELVTQIAIKETCLRPYPVGTVLVAMYGGYNQIGRTGLLRIPAAVNQAITAIQPNYKDLYPEYLLATLNFFVDYWKTVASSSRKDPNITSHDIRAFPLAVPPLSEQRAIAAALSDVDALLAKLDQLIVKKRDLKQAAMQQLLTGKRRLPGFSGEWEEKRLGEMFLFKNGLNKAKIYFGHGTPIVNYMDVYNGSALLCSSIMGKVEVSPDERKTYDVKKGDVFFTRTSETVDEIGIASVMLDTPSDTVFSGFLLRARPKTDSLRDEFKRYCFLSNSVRAQIMSRSSYTTRALTNGRLLSSVVLQVPKPEEQTAIATILSDMDAEIEVLEARRDKTRALKQGMMQELLTGRIRLV